MSSPFTLCIPAAFVLTVLNAGYDSPGWDVINHRNVMSSRLTPRPQSSERSGEQDLAVEVRQPLGAIGSSLGRLFSRWCLEFSLSLGKNTERGEKTLYGINWLLCVSILTWLPPPKCFAPHLQNETLKVKTSAKQFHLFTAHLNIDDILNGPDQVSFNWKSILLPSFAQLRSRLLINFVSWG